MKIKFLPTEELAERIDPDSPYAEVAADYLGQAEHMDAEQILAAIGSGCLIFRLYSEDTGYYFEAPIPLCEDADVASAYSEIYSYCLSEAIPVVIVGVPEEDLATATDGLTSAEVDEVCEGEYLLRIVTECMRCEHLPEAMYERVYLGEFASSYALDYARLLEDKELNKYYGYDITDDVKASAPIDYVESVRAEFERGESVTLAATVLSAEGKNVFVGDAVLYAFDGRGGASLAVRVLPEFQRQGLGSEIFLALCTVAEEIGLSCLRCDIMKENIPSVRMFSSFGTPSECESTVNFEFPIPYNK